VGGFRIRICGEPRSRLPRGTIPTRAAALTSRDDAHIFPRADLAPGPDEAIVGLTSLSLT
jgi:hypothetical protein